MLKRNKPLDEIYDLFAIRIILDTEDNNDCFAVYGIVSDIYIPNPERFKNYISVPKKNGYQSIHTTVVGPGRKDGRGADPHPRRCTRWRRKGVAAHWMYKEGHSAIDEELAQLGELGAGDFRERRGGAGARPQQLHGELQAEPLSGRDLRLHAERGSEDPSRRAPRPIDFAYEIHSKVGDHCLAAKVNGRIVPLDTPLKSGDQVEILTSKNQTPNPDWEKFVVTHKAKSHIRRWIKEEQRKAIEEGREIWEKRVKKAKLTINDDDLVTFLHEKKMENISAFFLGVRQEKIDPDEIIAMIQEEQKHPQAVVHGGREDRRIVQPLHHVPPAGTAIGHRAERDA